MALLRTITGCSLRLRVGCELHSSGPEVPGEACVRSLAARAPTTTATRVSTEGRRCRCCDGRRRSNSPSNRHPGRCSCNFLLSYPSRLYPIRVSFNGTVPPLDSTFLLIITFVTLLSKSGYDWTLLFLFLSVCSILPPGSYRAPGVYTNSSARAALAARAPGPATSAGPVPPESVSLPADPLSCTFATPVTLPPLSGDVLKLISGATGSGVAPLNLACGPARALLRPCYWACPFWWPTARGRSLLSFTVSRSL